MSDEATVKELIFRAERLASICRVIAADATMLTKEVRQSIDTEAAIVQLLCKKLETRND